MRPIALTPEKLTLIPAASRYAAGKDKEKDTQDFDDRSGAAFAGISKAMQDDQLIYASAELDRVCQTDMRNP